MPRRLALRCQSAEELGKKRRRGYQQRRQGEQPRHHDDREIAGAGLRRPHCARVNYPEHLTCINIACCLKCTGCCADIAELKCVLWRV